LDTVLANYYVYHYHRVIKSLCAPDDYTVIVRSQRLFDHPVLRKLQ